MAIEVKLPRLGQGMESGTIVRWLKAEGETVAKGEPLYELDTDKVTQEVEADSDGVLLKIVVADGEVDVGTTVGDHRRAGRGRLGSLRTAPRAGTEMRRPRRPPAEAPEAERSAEWRGVPTKARLQPAARRQAPAEQAPQRLARAEGERVKASPLARRIARERGIDLAGIAGPGRKAA